MNKPELKTVYTKSNIQPKEYYEGVANKTLTYLEVLIKYDKSRILLEEKQLLIFTPEEYNQHIKDIIKEILNDAADKATSDVEYDESDDTVDAIINKESITNTLEDTFNKLKYE